MEPAGRGEGFVSDIHSFEGNVTTNLTPHDGKRAVLLCLSHLRWHFVFQRPQQIMSRLARSMDVIFWEEPVFDATGERWLERSTPVDGVEIIAPHLAPGLASDAVESELRELLDEVVAGDRKS